MARKPLNLSLNVRIADAIEGRPSSITAEQWSKSKSKPIPNDLKNEEFVRIELIVPKSAIETNGDYTSFKVAAWENDKHDKIAFDLKPSLPSEISGAMKGKYSDYPDFANLLSPRLGVVFASDVYEFVKSSGGARSYQAPPPPSDDDDNIPF